MHIKTICPRCESTYLVDEGLKGKRMRCNNPICRAVFEVNDAAAAVVTPPPPAVLTPPRPPQSGAVGGMVPMLSAEFATAEETKTAPAPKLETTSAPREPATPGRRADATALPGVEASTFASEAALEDFFAGVTPVAHPQADIAATNGPAFATWDDGPPQRAGLDGQPGPGQVDGMLESPLPAFGDVAAGEPQRRAWGWPRVLVVCLMLAAGGITLWLVNAPGPTDEVERFARARREYQDGNFADAAKLFVSLVLDFHESDQRSSYRFMAELSEIRDAIQRSSTAAEDSLGHLDRVRKFVELYETHPLLKEHNPDITESLYRLVEDMTSFAAATKDRTLLETAKRLNADVAKKFKPAPLVQTKDINLGIAAAEAVISKEETRQRVLAQLRQFEKAPSLAAVEQAPVLVQEAGLADDAEIQPLLDGLRERHRKSVQFDADLAAASRGNFEGDNPPSIAVMWNRGRPPSGSSADSSLRPVLALVRGVLYAYDPATGVLRWACRVGVDTSELPLWLPATSATPPLVLVASSAAGGLLALNGNDGSVCWCQVLPQPCAGRPLLVGNRVFVACRDGTVVEIDPVGGRCLGGYRLGEQLIHGGVWQPGTDFVYFAANRGCVFALDVAQRQCTAILYTGHSSGALRSCPLVLPMSRGEVINPDKAGLPKAQLLLCLEDGQQNTVLVSYVLPIENPGTAAAAVAEKLPGHIWFSPLQSPDTISLVTSRGALAVFGLRQRDNLDAEVFPMLRDSIPEAHTGAGGDKPLVVHADGQSFWVLAHGGIHHFQVSMSPQEGWKIVSRSRPLGPLGTAVHEGQVRVDDAGTTLYLVTELQDGRTSCLTAVDLNRLTIRWQKHIGLNPQSAPAAVGGMVLAWDRGGDLLLFDPARAAPGTGAGWQTGVRAPVRHQPASTWLLPHGDGQTVVALAVQGREAQAWTHRAGSTMARGAAFALDEPLAGTPALVGETLVLPLAKGRLARLVGGSAIADADWRSPLADENAQGHVIPVGLTKLASTDGSHGLTLWRLDSQGFARLKAVTMKNRIIAPPALLPAVDQASFRLAVADVGRGVTLLQGDELVVVREWQLSDAITAGPFAAADGIVVVVGGRRLVWLDPNSTKPRWAITFSADIVGAPQLIDGALVVADESGKIKALDPATGEAVGIGYTLRADVAPAGPVLPYGPDHLFVPLTDGTVLLPSRMWFQAKLPALPLMR